MAVMYQTHPPWDPEGKYTYRTVQVGGQVYIVDIMCNAPLHFRSVQSVVLVLLL